MAKITVDIDPQGNAAVSVDGVAGKSCKDLTKGLEQALGNETKFEASRDYAKPEQSGVAAKQRG